MVRRRRWPSSGVLLAALLPLRLLGGPLALLAPQRARAADARAVVVVLVERGPAAARLERALRAHLSDLRVRMHVETVGRLPARTPQRLALARTAAAKRHAIAVLWHDASPQLYLYLAARRGDRLLVRRVESKRRVDRYEALALLARAHLRALLAGGRIAIAPPPAPAAASASAAATSLPAHPIVSRRAAPTARASIGLALQLGYALDVYAADAPTTHAMQIALAFALSSRLRVDASVRLLARASEQDARAAVTVRRYPIAIGAHLTLWRGRRVALRAFTRAGLELASAEPSAFAGLHAGAPSTAVLPFIAPGATVSVRLGRRFALYASVALTIALARERYVVSLPDGNHPLLSPWPVQPGLRLGVAADLL